LRQAREHLAQARMDLMLLDLSLPDGSSLDLLEDIDLAEHGQVALVTGNPSIDTAVRAVSAPVVEYLLKPLCADQLRELMQRTMRRRWTPAAEDAPPQSALKGLVGRSQQMRDVADTVMRIGPSDASVLISGESGTGKEIVARALHETSGRHGAFIAINCGAVPSELLASQLFGHEKGSFTGAHARHIGVFEQASHGTLLLDEIADMPMPLQVYLLRVLESGAVTRVGGQESIAIPVRVIAATNRDPLAAIASGHLREDLYYRLADIPLHLPPLRERGEDVILLANMFIDRLNLHYGRRKHLAAGIEPGLLRHPWPGNVRELRSAVQRAFLLDPGEAVRVRPTTKPAAACKEDATSILFTVGMTLAEIERRVLLKTLAHFDNDKTATAHALGVSVRTIHNQLARIAVENDGGHQGVAA
jgi:DNA-binding NtrC family response regulator